MYPGSAEYARNRIILPNSRITSNTDPEDDERPLILSSLEFTEDVYGKAEAASDHYLTSFKDTKRGAIAHCPAGAVPAAEATATER